MTDWPAMMRKRTAMDYLDLSEPEFEREIAAKSVEASTYGCMPIIEVGAPF